MQHPTSQPLHPPTPSQPLGLSYYILLLFSSRDPFQHPSCAHSPPSQCKE